MDESHLQSNNNDERLFIASYVVCSIKSDLPHTTLAWYTRKNSKVALPIGIFPLPYPDRKEPALRNSLRAKRLWSFATPLLARVIGHQSGFQCPVT